MNNQIIPLGPSEIVTDGTIAKKSMLIEALTELVITDLVFVYPATPPNDDVIDALTLPAGAHLFHVKSLTFTGTASIYYPTN